ncbi:hemK methyltransferase family member 2-like [Tetranychus urticae]|uniref:Methyltransferase HEMK2 n=1 Tax=Tetranychus urticae TaxID=32264 RepID=T1KXR2_TETUR|nr:hemK methyltransferase family member 2-like [Tetranychus urticae]
METPLYSTHNQSVYEPSEDSFLFLDALEKDLKLIKNVKPTICLEIGVGSGIITTALSKHLGSSNSYFIGTDINPQAGLACYETFRLNQLANSPQIVLTDLIESLSYRLRSNVDLIVFNPPYVPTEDSEIESDDLLTKSWAGGINGRRVIDRFCSSVSQVLATNGLLYLLLSKENQPDEVIEILKEYNINLDEIVIERKCRNEHLLILRFKKKASS